MASLSAKTTGGWLATPSCSVRLGARWTRLVATVRGKKWTGANIFDSLYPPPLCPCSYALVPSMPHDPFVHRIGSIQVFNITLDSLPIRKRRTLSGLKRDDDDGGRMSFIVTVVIFQLSFDMVINRHLNSNKESLCFKNKSTNRYSNSFGPTSLWLCTHIHRVTSLLSAFQKTVVHERLRTPQTRPVTRVVPIFSRLQLYFIYHPSDRNFSQGSDPSVSVYK